MCIPIDWFFHSISGVAGEVKSHGMKSATEEGDGEKNVDQKFIDVHERLTVFVCVVNKKWCHNDDDNEIKR